MSIQSVRKKLSSCLGLFETGIWSLSHMKHLMAQEDCLGDKAREREREIHYVHSSSNRTIPAEWLGLCTDGQYENRDSIPKSAWHRAHHQRVVQDVQNPAGGR